jgi:peptidoglycan/LPS O-acetylase OafA/YrhL
MRSKASHYRPDIDGLRAIAIFLVLVFHYYPSLIPGGYVGVDVFFVISGFLITGIIQGQIRDRTFSFRDFYARRVRRLFPALILVFCAVLLSGWLVLVDREFITLGKHVLGGVLFAYNYVAQSESGYFGGDTALKLIHHIWSLAIEEQFYWFFPLFLVGAWRFFKSLFAPLLVLVVISFLYNVTQISFVQTRVFYFPEYRMWELGVGGLLALFPASWLRSIPRHWKTVGASASLAVILLMSLILNQSSIFPGYLALGPVLASAGIIAFASETVVATILATAPMNYLGRISYPLYLWHWPLYSLANYFGMQDSPQVLLALLVSSVVLASLTYHLVETPIKSLGGNSTVTTSCLATMTLIGILAALIFNGWLPTRSSEATRKVSSGMVSYDPPKALMRFHDQPFNFIEGTGALKDQKVLVLGDSLAYQYYPRFEWLLSHVASSRALYMMTGGGCTPIPDLHKEGDGYCGYLRWVEEFVRKEKFDIVLVTGNWPVYFARENPTFHMAQATDVSQNIKLAQESLTNLVQKFRTAGAQVILVVNSPQGKELNPRSMVQRSVLNGVTIKPTTLPLKKYMETEGPIITGLNSIALKTGSQCMDPTPILCTKELCPGLNNNGEPLYKDDAHLFPGFVLQQSYLDFVFTDPSPQVPNDLKCL